MAGSLSGTIMGSYSGSNTYQPYLRWSISQNIAENRSTMSATFGMYKARANSQSYNINAREITVVVNGNTYTRSAGFDFRNAAVGSYNDMFTISNINISHNADGSKSVSMSATHSTGIALGTGTVSGTAILLDIPRATTPELSALFINLGDVLYITMSPAVESFRHNLTCKIGNSAYDTVAVNVVGTYAWTVPKVFANQITSSASSPAEIICETFNGSTSLGTKSVSFTLLVPDTPEFSPAISEANISVSDTDSALYTKFGGHVQNKSQLNINVSGVAVAYNSPITRYEISIGGKSYIGSQITTDTLTQSGTLAVQVTATDARGRYGSTSKNITVYPYTAPQITAYTVYRSNASGEADESGENITLDMAYNIASVDGKNDRYYQISYKKSTDESYTTAESGTAQTSYEGTHTLSGITFSTDYQWDIRFEIWDYFTNSNHIAWMQTVETEEVILDFKANKRGVAFGKVAELDDTVDFAWAVYLRNGISNIEELDIGYLEKNTVAASDLLAWAAQITCSCVFAVDPNNTSDGLPEEGMYFIGRITIESIYGRTLELIPTNSSGAIYINKYIGGQWIGWNSGSINVSSGIDIPVDIRQGELFEFSFFAQDLSDGNVTLRLNDSSPSVGGYTYTGSNINHEAGIITRAGGYGYASFSGFIQVISDRAIMWGSGWRASGDGFGWANAVWIGLTTVNSLQFNRSGIMRYKRI